MPRPVCICDIELLSAESMPEWKGKPPGHSKLSPLGAIQLVRDFGEWETVGSGKQDGILHLGEQWDIFVNVGRDGTYVGITLSEKYCQEMGFHD